MSIITNHQLESFRRDGYLICENILDVEEDIFPIYDEYDVLLDRVVDELFESGELPCKYKDCLLYTSPSPRDRTRSRMPSSA